jgi:hypothetical protein
MVDLNMDLNMVDLKCAGAAIASVHVLRDRNCLRLRLECSKKHACKQPQAVNPSKQPFLSDSRRLLQFKRSKAVPARNDGGLLLRM